MCREVVALVRFYLVGDVESVNFFEILPVAFTEGTQLFVTLAFLGDKAGIRITAYL